MSCKLKFDTTVLRMAPMCISENYHAFCSSKKGTKRELDTLRSRNSGHFGCQRCGSGWVQLGKTEMHVGTAVEHGKRNSKNGDQDSEIRIWQRYRKSIAMENIPRDRCMKMISMLGTLMSLGSWNPSLSMATEPDTILPIDNAPITAFLDNKVAGSYPYVDSVVPNVGSSPLGGYVPSPMELPEWQIWVGFVAGVIPFVIASVEFGKRIIIQRRCPKCQGRGLVMNSRGDRLIKCSQCGGMLPWLSWKAFWSSNLRVGNGGPLMQPKGQSTILYKVPQKSNSEEKGLRDDTELE